MREDWEEILYKDAVFKIPTSKQKLKQKEYSQFGEFPIVDQGKEVIGGYSNDSERILDCKLPVVVFGDHSKCVKLINFKFVPGADGTKVLEPKSNINPKFISYLTHVLIHKIKDKGYARHYQYIEKEKLPLASLPEQRAIVAKIEELFSDLDKGIADLKKAQAQLKVYRQAVLKKAFEGELTKEWREQQIALPTADKLLEQIKEERQKYYEQQIEDWKNAVKDCEKKGKEGEKPKKPSLTKTVSPLTPEEFKYLYNLPNHWKWLKLSEVSQEMCLGKMLDKKKNQGSFKPYLANINVRWGEFNLQFIKEMRFLDSENERYNILKGDLVICEGGEPGRCAVWNNIEEIKIQKALHRVRFFKDYTSSNFVYHFFKFSALNGTLSRYFTGTTIKHLTGQSLAKVPIPGLSLLEQHQIVQEIESRLSVCEKVEQSITESLEKAKALRQSILKKAFEGTLLSKEEIAACKASPDYEPASVLLEKIKTEKNTKSKTDNNVKIK